MKGLKFLKRDSGGGLTLVSFHSPANMCWSWFLSFTRFRGDEARVFPIYGLMRLNSGLQRFWRVPWLGMLCWHRQFNVMPYRDLYIRERDRRDGLDDEPPPPPPPPRTTVIDGGWSIH